MVLNRIAMSVVVSMRSKPAAHVFCYQGKPVLRMLKWGLVTGEECGGITADAGA